MDPYEETFRTYHKIAAAYQDKFMDMTLYNDSYDLFCSLMPRPGSRIFELACGPGNITRYLAQKRPDFRIEATDIAPGMLELARNNVPTARFRQLDAREIGSLEPGFDGIICGFGLPYLSPADAAGLIRDCAYLLHDDGIFYCSMVPGEESRSGYQQGSSGDRVYFYYHQETALLEQFQKSDFEIITVQSLNYPVTEDNLQKHTIFIARKQRYK